MKLDCGGAVVGSADIRADSRASAGSFGVPEQAGAEVVRRYADLLDRLTIHTPNAIDPRLVARVAATVPEAAEVTA